MDEAPRGRASSRRARTPCGRGWDISRATAGPRYGRSSSIWSGPDRSKSNTPQLFSRRLFIMHRKRPSGENPISWPGRKNLVERDFPVVVVDLLHRILVRRILVELDEGDRREILFGIENDDAAAQANHGRGPTPARMPDGTIGAGEAVRIVARDRAFLDEQFAHRHHFPLDLLPLGAEVIVLAGRLVGIDFRDLQGAALLPALRHAGRVGHPVVFQRGDDPGRIAVEAGGDVLLPVRHEIGLGILGIDRHVNAQPEAGGFRHVFQKLHLRAVVAHAIDVEARSGRSGCGSECRRSANSCRPGCC